MTPVDLDAAAAVVLSWLLTYAIHSTILLTLAAVAAWRLADQHAWLDLIWKTAVIAPLVTASLHLDSISLPLTGRWTMPSVTTVTRAPTVGAGSRNRRRHGCACRRCPASVSCHLRRSIAPQ